MEQALQYHYPPKINVPRGLRTIIEGLSRAVVQRQPESIPHFATLYFAELLRFSAAHRNDEIQGLVKQFHEKRVNRLPSRGLGTMKDVRSKKPTVVATAALVTIRANQLKEQQMSATMPAKPTDDREQHVDNNQETITETPVAPEEHQKLSSPQPFNSKSSQPKASLIVQSQDDSSKTLAELTKDVAVEATKPVPMKEIGLDDCKLVKPQVPTEEPVLEESLGALGPQDENFTFLVNQMDSVTQEETTSHLQGKPISTGSKDKSSGLVYPPLPTEQEIYSVNQQEWKTARTAVTTPVDGSFVQVNQDDTDFVLGFESKLPSDRSSTTVLGNGPHKLIRPLAPAADPELIGVTHAEWIPPKMEEDVIAELIDKQLKKLLNARPKKVKNVNATAPTISKQKLISPSALCQDPRLLQTSEEMTGIGSTQPPSSSLESNSTDAPHTPSRQAGQQMLYLAVPMPYILAGGLLPQNFDPTAVPGTEVPPTTDHLHPLNAELKSPQNAIHPSPETAQFSQFAGMPTMMFPFMNPQVWGSFPVAQPHSAETTAAGCSETPGQSESCQATQNNQQTSASQAAMDTPKYPASPHMPLMALAPTMHALCPLGASPFPSNHAGSLSRPSQETNSTPLFSTIPLLHQPVVPVPVVYQAGLQTPSSDHVVTVSTHQEGC